MAPSLQALRQLAPKLLNSPQAVWSRRTFGAVELAPLSWVIVAFTGSQVGGLGLGAPLPPQAAQWSTWLRQSGQLVATP